MDLFEAGHFNKSVELIDQFLNLTNYPPDIFKEYLRDYLEGTTDE